MSMVFMRNAPRISAVVVLAAGVLAGCAKRDSITVGSVPDDYRTNHPIVISERDKVIDIPVGVADSRMTHIQKTALDGFVANYDRSAAPLMMVMVPYGSANQAAASHVAQDMIKRLRSAGVPDGKIVHQPYEASNGSDNAPVRLVYKQMTASTGQCGRWPDDMLKDSDNKHWANFGCSYQNNLAAQIANPADLLGPRQSDQIDTGRRSAAIDQYRGREASWKSNIEY
jgi:pilus assembly protein CpaD